VLPTLYLSGGDPYQQFLTEIFSNSALIIFVFAALPAEIVSILNKLYRALLINCD
jgi:hypothetical protein